MVWDAQSYIVRCRSHFGDEGIASKKHLLVCAFCASYTRGKPNGGSGRVEGLRGCGWCRGRLEGWEGGTCEKKEGSDKEDGKEESEARVAEEKHRSASNSVGVAVVGDQVGWCRRGCAGDAFGLGSVLSATVCGAALSAVFRFARDLNPDTVRVSDLRYTMLLYMKLAPGNEVGIALVLLHFLKAWRVVVGKSNVIDTFKHSSQVVSLVVSSHLPEPEKFAAVLDSPSGQQR